MAHLRTDKERIALMHEKAEQLENQRMLRRYGSISLCLLVLLFGTIIRIDLPFQSVLNSGFTGASLLSESAGGYVLVAVLSFVAAVCITVYCLRRNKKS